MIHEQLDIAHWTSFFSLERLRAEVHGQPASAQPEACIISGPYDIAVLEQLRAEAFASEPGIARVPTDVFVWNRGEPENRAVTKIGGLPYRDAGKPWPMAPSGVPMNFVAQVCFADSKDIVPSLPGDILLIFAEGKEWSPGNYDFLWGDFDQRDSAVHLEWVALGGAPLMTANEVPGTGWHILSAYAAIHRTWDYPDADGFAYSQVAEHIAPVFEATKIGGVSPWLDEEEEESPGEYLFSLSSLDNEISRPYPFLNVAEPITYFEWRDSGRLMLGDVGLLNFFISGSGDLRWTGHSH